jgi:hypothetical protein
MKAFTSYLRFSLLITLIGLYVPLANASATEADFESCNKKAAYQLLHCLEDNSHNSNKHCWVKSQQMYDNCVRAVKNRHNPDRRQGREEVEDQIKLAEQFKEQKKLDKQLKANKIKVRLMAAANKRAYRLVLEKAVNNLEEKQSLTHLTPKQTQAVGARALAYQRFLSLVDDNVACDDMRDKITAMYTADTTKNTRKTRSNALPKAAREILKYKPSYCRMQEN